MCMHQFVTCLPDVRSRGQAIQAEFDQMTCHPRSEFGLQSYALGKLLHASGGSCAVLEAQQPLAQQTMLHIK